MEKMTRATMKFKIKVKAPDSFYEGLRDVVDNFSDPEDRHIVEGELRDFLSRWVGGMEYITLEFDTDEKTAVMVEND
jgi:hypothetical protein